MSIFAQACNGSAYTMNLNPKKQIKTSEPWEFFHICLLRVLFFYIFLQVFYWQEVSEELGTEALIT